MAKRHQARNHSLPKAQKYTIADFNAEFPDDDACLNHIFFARWPDGITTCYSKACGNVERRHHRVSGRTAYACDHCGKHIYPLAGTIFEKTTTSLKLWFYAIYLIGSTRCGISAKQLQRETGVTYKTAWRMFKQIRTLMSEDIRLEGSSVEVDETFHGAPKKNQHISRRREGTHKDKQPIFGIVERKGRVIARVVPDVKEKTLLPILATHVLPSTTVYTDSYVSYDNVGWMGRNYKHHRINHSAGVYVQGHVHTQTIEGFWSLLKRGIEGVYHSVSRKYLQNYCNEYAYRYNHRDEMKPMFISLLEQVSERAAS